MKVLNVFSTTTGNTKIIAETLGQTASNLGHEVDALQIRKSTEPDVVNFLDYDFVFIGSGVYEWLPGKPIMDFVTKSHKKHLNRGHCIIPAAVCFRPQRQFLGLKTAKESVLCPN